MNKWMNVVARQWDQNFEGFKLKQLYLIASKFSFLYAMLFKYQCVVSFQYKAKTGVYSGDEDDDYDFDAVSKMHMNYMTSM